MRRRGLLLEAVVEHKFALSLTRAALLHSLLLALALIAIIAIIAVRILLSVATCECTYSEASYFTFTLNELK